MGQIHLCVRRAAFRRENQPTAVGRKAVPGVHERGVALHAARDSSLRGHDKKPAVGAHEQPVAGLDKDDPAAVGRNLGEGIAHAIAGSAKDWLGAAAFSIIERDTVQIVFDLGFLRIVGEPRRLLPLRIRIPRLSTRKHQVLAVRTPHRIGLHRARIIGAGQVLQTPRCAAVPGQDAASGVKDLKEMVVLEIRDIVITHEILRVLATLIVALVNAGIVDGCNHIPAVGGYLRHESHP